MKTGTAATTLRDTSSVRDLEARFDRACDLLLGELAAGEALSVEFSGEHSTFMRFNGAKVRQIGEVDRALVEFKYYRDGKTIGSSIPLGGDKSEDTERTARALTRARREAALLPEDPYQTLPGASGVSRERFTGTLPDPDRIPEEVLAPTKAIPDAGADFVGLHSQGPVCRGAANSLGARHWFSTETFSTDYSAHLPGGKAIKSCYAGRNWDGAEYRRRLESERPKLEAMGKPEKALAPGGYRVYIAPDALAEFMAFFSWNGLSERQMREGESAWIALKDGRSSLSPRFGLTQDFGLGVQPRFNELGEVAPERLSLIERGRLANTLVSARTAKQYGIASNAAPAGEFLRSGAIDPGDLAMDGVLDALGTGLYISNLHYLNWSDFDSARVTGMTRFACLWVEDGKIVAPIKDMRFDESLYRLWGDKLAAVTAERSLVVETGSYFFRSLEGSLLPGMLADGFTLTL
ncbi:MAG: metallopeptidase TldD-related protein [Rectinemataceae bacterium]|nr:metallopeptidase TldD-related protein [Rectinemataceae bacterium]